MKGEVAKQTLRLTFERRRDGGWFCNDGWWWVMKGRVAKQTRQLTFERRRDSGWFCNEGWWWAKENPSCLSEQGWWWTMNGRRWWVTKGGGGKRDPASRGWWVASRRVLSSVESRDTRGTALMHVDGKFSTCAAPARRRKVACR